MEYMGGPRTLSYPSIALSFFPNSESMGRVEEKYSTCDYDYFLCMGSCRDFLFNESLPY